MAKISRNSSRRLLGFLTLGILLSFAVSRETTAAGDWGSPGMKMSLEMMQASQIVQAYNPHLREGMGFYSNFDSRPVYVDGEFREPERKGLLSGANLGSLLSWMKTGEREFHPNSLLETTNSLYGNAYIVKDWNGVATKCLVKGIVEGESVDNWIYAGGGSNGDRIDLLLDQYRSRSGESDRERQNRYLESILRELFQKHGLESSGAGDAGKEAAGTVLANGAGWVSGLSAAIAVAYGFGALDQTVGGGGADRWECSILPLVTLGLASR